MVPRLLAVVLLVGCGPHHAPPDWLQGDWTSRSNDKDTAWFEWTFTADRVLRREFNGFVLLDEADFGKLGYREEQEDGVYALVSALGSDTRDTFFRTDDADVVTWRSESPFFVVRVTEGDLTRLQ